MNKLNGLTMQQCSILMLGLTKAAPSLAPEELEDYTYLMNQLLEIYKNLKKVDTPKKCPKCGAANRDLDYCTCLEIRCFHCGELASDCECVM